jgi:hypoxanthine phosphoribosyltransferase
MPPLPPIKQILYTEEQLRERVRALGHQITRDYQGRELVMIGVLTSSVYFFTDLTRAIDLPVLVDFIDLGHISQSATQKGIVRITKDLDLDISDRHVLVVEDIVRTGLTVGYLIQNLSSRMPASIKVCSLLVNPEQQILNIPIAYSGFTFSSSRLIGYGLDIGGAGRNLPYIAEVEK